MINCLRNSYASVVPNKWHFDLSLDWKTLALDFESFSTDDLADKALRTLGFYIIATEYLEERFPRFINVTDLELIAKPVMIDNPGQVVTESDEELIKKKNKYTVKKSSSLQNFIFLLDHFCFFVMDPLLFSCFVVYPFLFLILDLLLFCYYVVCLLLFFVLYLSLFYVLLYSYSCFLFWIPCYFIILLFACFNCICSFFFALLCSCFSS